MKLENIFIENYKNFLPSLFSIGFRIFSNEDNEIILKNDKNLRIVIQIHTLTNGIKTYFIDENGKGEQPFYPSGNKSIFFPSVFFECLADFLRKRGYISCEYNSISQTFKYNVLEIDVSDEAMSDNIEIKKETKEEIKKETKGEINNEEKLFKSLEKHEAFGCTSSDITEILENISVISIEGIVTNDKYNVKEKNKKINDFMSLILTLKGIINMYGV